MAIPRWLLKEAQRDIDAGITSYDSLGEEAKRSLKPPTVSPATRNLDQADQTAKNRRIVNGVDPALAIVTPTGQGNFHQLQDFQNEQTATNAADYAKKNKNFLNPYIPDQAAELLKRKQSYYYTPKADDSGLSSFAKKLFNEQQRTRLMDDQQYLPEVTTGNKVADSAAGLLGFGLGLIGPGGEAGAMTSASGSAMNGATKLLSPLAPKVAGLAEKGVLGKAGSRAIHGGVAGLGYGGVEGVTQGMSPTDTVKNMGKQALQFGAAETVLGGAGDLAGDFAKYGGKYLGEPKAGELLKRNTLPRVNTNPFAGNNEVEVDDPYANTVQEWKQAAEPDFTVGPLGRTHVGKPQLELPAGKQPIALPPGNKPLALGTTPTPMLPAGKIPNWEIYKDRTEPTGNPPIALGPNYYVDPYGVARTGPGMPAALPEGLPTVPGINLRGKKGNITYPSEAIVKNEIQSNNPSLSLKREPQPPEVERLNRAMQKRLGPIKIGGGKAEYAPEAMNNPEMQAADLMAKSNTGRSVIPVKNLDAAGAQLGDNIYVNANTKQPLLYVLNHEVIHVLEKIAPEVHARLTQIIKEHIANQEGITNHYNNLEYGPETHSRELTSDVMAEKMLEPEFWARVRGESPGILKKVLDVIDNIVANFKGKVGDDMTVMPYLKDIDVMRNRLADEYQGYLADIKNGRIQGQEVAAKAEANFKNETPNDIRSIVEAGAEKLKKTGIKWSVWSKEMLAEHPELEQNLPYIWQRSQELLNQGKTTLKMGGQEILVGKSAVKPSTELPPVPGAGTMNYKDISGGQIYGQDIYRNENQFHGKDMELEPGSVTNQFTQAKSGNIDYQNSWLERLKEVTEGLGITKGSKLSSLVQRYGEGGTKYFAQAPSAATKSKMLADNFINNLKKQHGDSNVTPELDKDGKLIGAMIHRKYDYNDLVNEVGAEKAAKVVQAENWFRQTYNEMLDQVNKTRAEIYPNADKKMTDIEKQIEALKDEKGTITYINEKLKKYYDVIDDINNSPNRDPARKKELMDEVTAKIEKLRNSDLYTKEGRTRKIEALETEYERAMRGKFVPKRDDYFHHTQEMTGLGGLKNIFGSPAEISPELAGRSDFTLPKSKFHGFMQKQGLGAYKEDAVGGFLKYLPEASYSIHIDPMISKFEGQADDLSVLTNKTKDANNFINFLRKFSQDLAGKTNPIDRVPQEKLGRRNMAMLSWLNSRAKGNAIRFNLGTPLIQPTNIAQGLAFAKKDSAIGIGRAITDLFSDNPLRNQSAFLKERFHAGQYRQFDTRLIDQPGRFADWMLEFSDRLGTDAVWYSCYQKGLNTKGISNPIAYADSNARRLVAGRGIGEIPLQQKSKIVQTFMPFTLEVANMWKIQKDFVKEKDFAGLVTLFAGLWVANNIIEKTRGDRPLFDPVDAIADAVNIMAGENGKGTGEKAILAGGRLGGEVLSNLPGGQFAAQLYPEYGFKVGDYQMPSRKGLMGDSDPTRFGTGILPQKALQDPGKYLLLPYGGAQVDKSLKGLDAIQKSGVYKDEKTMNYPIVPDATNAVGGVLFGRGAFRESQDYYKNNRRPLSENQTQQVEGSGDRQAQYDLIMKQRKIESIVEQIRTLSKDNKLTDQEKQKRIQELWQTVDKVGAGQ